MSRARPIELPEALHPLFEDDPAFRAGKYWMDVKKNGRVASDEQIELLALIEDVDLDDLLDTVLTQGEVLFRLRCALGQTGVIPTDVLERRERWRHARQLQPCCRKCGKEGDSTKHHFVNRWLLRELKDYTPRWADTSKNTIPLCIFCHRELHSRRDEDKRIAPLLSASEREFVENALSALAEERPKLLLLVARGDANAVYEACLIQDWIAGKFREEVFQMSDPKTLRLISCESSQ